MAYILLDKNLMWDAHVLAVLKKMSPGLHIYALKFQVKLSWHRNAKDGLLFSYSLTHFFWVSFVWSTSDEQKICIICSYYEKELTYLHYVKTATESLSKTTIYQSGNFDGLLDVHNGNNINRWASWLHTT